MRDHNRTRLQLMSEREQAQYIAVAGSKLSPTIPRNPETLMIGFAMMRGSNNAATCGRVAKTSKIVNSILE